MAVLEVNGLKKIYTTRFGGNRVQALTNVSFAVERGEYVAIMGESGSGKTTLLNILAALDRPTQGEVWLNGRALSSVSEKEIAAFRRQNLGFVFQDFNLLDTFSLQDNIFLPLVLAGKHYPEMNQRLRPIVEKLGISDILSKYPYEVSGGQRADHVAADHPGGRADRRARLPRGRQSAFALRRNQPRRPDDPDGYALHEGRKPREPRAVHQGRRRVPPALPRRRDERGAVPPHFGHAHDDGDRNVRCDRCDRCGRHGRRRGLKGAPL